MGLRASKTLFLLVPFLALFQTAFAKADAIQSGVQITVYNNYGYNASPPIPPNRPIVGTDVVSQIDQNFDQNPVFQMYEDFVVKYEGFLAAPCTCPVQFMLQADDGTRFYLGQTLITDDWRDKGGGGTVSNAIAMNEGESQPFTIWFYENGGGAWVQFWWLHNGAWEIVPASAFSLMPTVLTTTTTSTSTTTTTTLVRNTVPPSTSTTTTTSPTTTTTSSTTTTVPSTTTSSTSTTSTTTSSTSTVALTTTTTTTSTPQTTTTIVDATTTSTTSSTTTTTTTPSTTTSTIPDAIVTDEEATALVSALADLEPEEVTVTQLAAVLDPEVTEKLTDEQVDEVVEVIAESVDALSDEELLVLAEVLTNASDAVKSAFQNKINVFSGKFDTYVPTGSVVSVGQRRVLNAVVGTLMAVPVAAAPTRRSI